MKKNMLTFPEHLMSLGFYESSYIVQALVLSVFVSLEKIILRIKMYIQLYLFSWQLPIIFTKNR